MYRVQQESGANQGKTQRIGESPPSQPISGPVIFSKRQALSRAVVVNRPCSQLTHVTKKFRANGLCRAKDLARTSILWSFRIEKQEWRPCEGCLFGCSCAGLPIFQLRIARTLLQPRKVSNIAFSLSFLFFFFNFFPDKVFIGLSVKDFLTTSTEKYIRGVALACISGLSSQSHLVHSALFSW